MRTRHQTAEPSVNGAHQGPGCPDRPSPPWTSGTRKVLHVGVVDEFPLITHGLVAMLAPYAPGLLVHTGLPGTATPGPVDITLYDPTTRASVTPTSLATLLDDPACGRVLIYSLNPAPSLVDEWLAAGCAGFVDKRTSASVLVEAIQSLVIQKSATARGAPPHDSSLVPPDDWPGQQHGLSRRESEMLALITRGLTNADICAGCGLSINTVKTYIRSAYAKLAITRRPQAVRWGVQHGMLDPGARHVAAAADSPRPPSFGAWQFRVG